MKNTKQYSQTCSNAVLSGIYPHSSLCLGQPVEIRRFSLCALECTGYFTQLATTKVPLCLSSQSARCNFVLKASAELTDTGTPGIMTPTQLPSLPLWIWCIVEGVGATHSAKQRRNRIICLRFLIVLQSLFCLYSLLFTGGS